MSLNPVDTADIEQLVLEANERFNKLSPEEQEIHHLAQRISFVYGQVRFDIDDTKRAESLLKEDVARRVLTCTLGPHSAKQRLSDPRFRKLLDLSE